MTHLTSIRINTCSIAQAICRHTLPIITFVSIRASGPLITSSFSHPVLLITPTKISTNTSKTNRTIVIYITKWSSAFTLNTLSRTTRSIRITVSTCKSRLRSWNTTLSVLANISRATILISFTTSDEHTLIILTFIRRVAILGPFITIISYDS